MYTESRLMPPGSPRAGPAEWWYARISSRETRVVLGARRTEAVGGDGDGSGQRRAHASLNSAWINIRRVELRRRKRGVR